MISNWFSEAPKPVEDMAPEPEPEAKAMETVDGDEGKKYC